MVSSEFSGHHSDHHHVRNGVQKTGRGTGDHGVFPRNSATDMSGRGGVARDSTWTLSFRPEALRGAVVVLVFRRNGRFARGVMSDG